MSESVKALIHVGESLSSLMPPCGWLVSSGAESILSRGLGSGPGWAVVVGSVVRVASFRSLCHVCVRVFV